MIRTAWVVFAGAALTAVLGGAIIVSSWLRRPGVICLCDRLSRFWARCVLRTAGVRVRLEGADRVDWTRPAVLAANHQSWFDVFALHAYLPGKGRFVAKEELGRIPIFGRSWKVCGHIAVDRGDRKRAIESLHRAGERVRDESLAVILFPEGTRSPDGRLQPFKKGAFVLAIRTGVPVVPVGISGSRAVMAKGSFRVRSGEVRIRFGEPIPVEGMEHADRDRLRLRSRDAIRGLMEDPDGVTGQPGGLAGTV